MKKTIPLISILLLLTAGILTVFVFRVSIREALIDARRPELPVAQPYTPPTTSQKVKVVRIKNESEIEKETNEAVKEFKEESEIIINKEPEPIPVTVPANEEGSIEEIALVTSINHGVPFSSQAPHADWSLPFQEACEETSLIMVNAWMVGTPPGTLDPNIATGLILDLVKWQEERFGYYEDTTVEETAIIARDFYGYKNTEVLPVTSIDDVTQKLAEGFVVILPAAGAKLQNPYFSGTGPLYHMIVAKGFTENGQIITNDPGTKRGADFLYDPGTLFDAIGDWNDGDPAEGEKLMLIIRL